jgi:hypothetical protein
MRIMALVLAGALAVCFMDPASAATKRSAQSANPDRSAYPSSAGCGTSAAYCYRSGHQKSQKHKDH